MPKLYKEISMDLIQKALDESYEKHKGDFPVFHENGLVTLGCVTMRADVFDKAVKEAFRRQSPSSSPEL